MESPSTDSAAPGGSDPGIGSPSDHLRPMLMRLGVPQRAARLAQRVLEQYLVYRDVRGLAGYALDLVDISQMRFCNPHGLTKFLLIDGLRRRTNAENFIEAGTFHGTTAARCARTFKRLLTIQRDPNAPSNCADFLKPRHNLSLTQPH